MTETLRIAICEDKATDTEHLCSLIGSSGIPASVSRYEDGGAFLASLPAGRFDIVFFDIYMTGIDGVQTARVLRQADDECGLVFTTTSPDYMAEAFELEADQYLIKPVPEEKLHRVLHKRVARLKKTQQTCSVSARGQRMEIALDDICYVEVYNHQCIVHTVDRIVETGATMTIDKFEAQLLPPRFYRCHKSYIVNFSHVQEAGRDFLMKNGDTVYIRRGDVAFCRRELDKWRLYEAGRDEE